MKTARKPLKSVALRECGCGPMQGQSSADEPVIRRVKVLGRHSKNGREYLEEAIDSAVAIINKGRVPVFIDHKMKLPAGWPEQDRPAMSKFGRLENARKENGEAWADLVYNPDHLYASTVRGWVKSDDTALGFSINATGKVREAEDGKLVVCEVTEIESVDLVESPATTHGLFESASPKPTPKRVTESMNPDDLMAGLDGSDKPAAVADESGEVKTLADKIGEVLAHLAKDETMDSATRLRKLKAALKVLDEGAEEAAEAEIPVKEEEEMPAEESGDKKDKLAKAEESVRKSADPHGLVLLEAYRKEKAENEARKLREAMDALLVKSRKMCVEANLPAKAITETFVKTLAESRDDAARAELIADRKSIMGVVKSPVSLPPSAGVSGKKLSAEDLLAGLS